MARGEPAGSWVRFGVFEVNFETGELRKHGLKIKLREQSFQILALLLARPGQVVSREELQNQLWPAETFVDFDRGLNRAVNQLRDALGDSADNSRFIETLPKRGYRFVASVESPEFSLIAPRPGNRNGGLTVDSAPQPVLDLKVSRRSAVPWAIATLLAVLFITGVLLWKTLPWRTQQTGERTMMRFSDDLGPDAITGRAPLGGFFGPAISPDGKRLVFAVKAYGGKQRLATRRLDQAVSMVLAGTEGAQDPFFSPDGEWIGFFSGQKMKKVPVEGGAVVNLSDTNGLPRGGSWREDGTIIANLELRHLFRVSSAGGSSQLIGKPEEHGEQAWQRPQVLPGGDKVLFTGATAIAGAAADNSNIEVLSLKSGQVKIVHRGGYFGRYLPSGHLVYIRNGTLFAIPFDLARLETRGEPMPVVEDIADAPGAGAGRFDFSRTGTLVYFSGNDPATLTPASWIDSAGKIDPIINTPTQAETPRLSPDGKRLALSVAGDLVVYDIERGGLTKLTSNAALNRHPIWTADGTHLVFSSDTASSAGEYAIWWIRADGSMQPEKLFTEKAPLQPWSISPDGRRIAFVRSAKDTTFEIWTLALNLADPDHVQSVQLEPFLREPNSQIDPAFSPDAKWIAYATGQREGNQVFVRPLPSTPSSPRWQVAAGGGGRFPIWSRNGRELFYLDNNNRIMVVRYSASKDSFVAEKPRQWSPVEIFRPPSRSVWNLDLAPDGKRFVALALPHTGHENGATVHVTVLLNFFDELRRRMPGT